MSAIDILSEAHDEIVSLAADVGIDGQKLMQSLPASGHLMTGSDVPVLHQRYQSACNVLLYVNQTLHGIEWPFLRFYTFKDGGHERTFNGLRWLRQIGEISGSRKPVKFQRTMKNRHRCYYEEQHRLHRHQQLCSEYGRSIPLPVDHPWLAARLCGHADASLVARTNLRLHGQRLIAPLLHHEHELPGFHCVSLDCSPNRKRHYVRKAGLLKGSYIPVLSAQSQVSERSLPIMVCEGVATGLTLALVWRGEIRIALSADNLKAVRSSIPGPVIMCSDNDQWKPDVGNVGLSKAKAVLRAGDQLRCPDFACTDLDTHPTDFNDLLMQAGFVQLRTQLTGEKFAAHG